MYYKVVAHEMLCDAEAWKIPSGCENSGGSKTEMVFELFRDLNKEPMQRSGKDDEAEKAILPRVETTDPNSLTKSTFDHFKSTRLLRL